MKKVFPTKEGNAHVLTLSLTDSSGAAVALANITTATLWLWDAEDEAAPAINSRTAQDVKNANQVTIGATDGLVTWTMLPADNPIRNARKGAGDTELHQFMLEIVHNQVGSPFRECYGIRVEALGKVAQA